MAAPISLYENKRNLRWPGSYAVKQLQDWATQNIAGVILDRSAGGADLPSVAEIGSLFAQEGQPLFRVIAADNREPVTYSSNKSSPLPVPVMALIDADTSGGNGMSGRCGTQCQRRNADSSRLPMIWS